MVDIFGHRPPRRLDFAYCKLRVKAMRASQDQAHANHDEKDAHFMVVHGGMDTEGNIFDDLFFINLD